jgi:monovalent cation:proton antiporter-2 (CPA2) family protein
VIGPAGFGWIGDTGTATSVAELGVVLLLFIVGLELKVSRLLSMRADIFGLGLAQLSVCAAVLGSLALWFKIGPSGAFVIGIALGLSATAIALQMLEERGDLSAPYGQRAFAILLFQDLSIAPLLAMLPLLATAGGAGMPFGSEALIGIAEALAAFVAVVLIGRFGLNPLFRLLGSSGAREVLTAAALLVVLGAALLMEHVGLSMAMGAFLAGVLLAESNFRHQLEADIEPFRGILLGLFFISVGMSIRREVVTDSWAFLLVATPAVVALKIGLIAGLMRLFGSSWRDSLRASAVLATAGEFAFVLLQLGQDFRILDRPTAQLMTALAALTMLLGPLAAKAIEAGLGRFRPPAEQIEESFDDSRTSVLVVGFGRFGQVVNQVLLARGVDVTVIDNNVERIRAAARFGFKVYFGDGTRLDVLRAAGAGRARIVCVCVDDKHAALKIVELLHAEFRNARTYVRAYDRVHALDLMRLDVDYQLRETFESAIVFGRAALEELGLEPAEAAAVAGDVHRRDIVRLMMQLDKGLLSGSDLLHGATVQPEPLTAPKAKPHGLSPETRDIIGEDETADA